MWRIPKLIIIGYEKCLLLEINTTTEFLLAVYLIIDTYNIFIIPMRKWTYSLIYYLTANIIYFYQLNYIYF